MIVPHVFQQHCAGHNLPGVLHQIFEQPELTRLKRDFFGAARDKMRQPIEAEIADPIGRLLAASAGAAGPA